MQWKKLWAFRRREDAWAETEQTEGDTVLLMGDSAGFPSVSSPEDCAIDMPPRETQQH
jgi:hypothetical protein